MPVSIGRRPSTIQTKDTVATGAARPRLFYGWYIVGVALLAQCVMSGTQAFTSGLFLTPMTQELGWSRESFSAVQTVSTVVMGGLGLLIGGMVDRRGPR